ncbi:MAG: hypothetical protein V3U57_05540 [Robiginitomaculum sp.]
MTHHVNILEMNGDGYRINQRKVRKNKRKKGNENGLELAAKARLYQMTKVRVLF